MADHSVALVDPANLLLELTPDSSDVGVVLVSAADLVYAPASVENLDSGVVVVSPSDLIYVIDMEGGGAEETVVNRVWDTVAGDFVRWVTAGADSAGASYPGPGTFGVDTSDYVVETVKYARV